MYNRFNMRLPGNARTGVHFLGFPPAPVRASAACGKRELKTEN